MQTDIAAILSVEISIGGMFWKYLLIFLLLCGVFFIAGCLCQSCKRISKRQGEERMVLRQLRYFQSVVRLNSFSGTADEVANAAELLMSDRGAFISGSTFLVDGGATASYFYGPLKPENKA